MFQTKKNNMMKSGRRVELNQIVFTDCFKQTLEQSLFYFYSRVDRYRVFFFLAKEQHGY